MCKERESRRSHRHTCGTQGTGASYACVACGKGSDWTVQVRTWWGGDSPTPAKIGHAQTGEVHSGEQTNPARLNVLRVGMGWGSGDGAGITATMEVIGETGIRFRHMMLCCTFGWPASLTKELAASLMQDISASMLCVGMRGCGVWDILFVGVEWCNNWPGIASTLVVLVCTCCGVPDVTLRSSDSPAVSSREGSFFSVRLRTTRKQGIRHATTIVHK